jgi:hypothetical protein
VRAADRRKQQRVRLARGNCLEARIGGYVCHCVLSSRATMLRRARSRNVLTRA